MEKQTGNTGQRKALAVATSDTVLELFTKNRELFSKVLPQQRDGTTIDVGRYVEYTILGVKAVISESKTLQACSPNSIFKACLLAARAGLDLFNGEAWLIPYQGICTYQPGYKGLVRLLRESDNVKHVTSDVVYTDDEFSFQKYPFVCVHKLHRTGRGKSEQVDGAYAIVEYLSGISDGEYMSNDEIRKIVDQVRARSLNGKETPAWRDWYGEMARKSVLKRLCKHAPKSTQMAYVLKHEETLDRGERVSGSVTVDGNDADYPVLAESNYEVEQLEAKSAEGHEGAEFGSPKEHAAAKLAELRRERAPTQEREPGQD